MPKKTNQERDDEQLLSDANSNLLGQTITAGLSASAGVGSAIAFSKAIPKTSKATIAGMRINAKPTPSSFAKFATKITPKGKLGVGVRTLGGGMLLGAAGRGIDAFTKDTEEDTAKKVVRFAKMNGDEISMDEALKMVKDAGDPYKNAKTGALGGVSPTALLGDKVRGVGDFITGGNSEADQGSYGSDRALLETVAGHAGLGARLVNNRIESFGYDAHAKSLADIHHSAKTLTGVGNQATRDMLQKLGYNPSRPYGGFESKAQQDTIVNEAEMRARDKFPEAFDPKFDYRKRPARKFADIPNPDERDSTASALPQELYEAHPLEALQWRAKWLGETLSDPESLTRDEYTKDYQDRFMNETKDELGKYQQAIDSGRALHIDDFYAKMKENTDRFSSDKAQKQREAQQRMPNYGNNSQIADSNIRGALGDAGYAGVSGSSGDVGLSGSPSASSSSSASALFPDAERNQYLAMDPNRRWMIKGMDTKHSDLWSKDIEDQLNQIYGPEESSAKTAQRGKFFAERGTYQMSQPDYDADTAYRAKGNTGYSFLRAGGVAGTNPTGATGVINGVKQNANQEVTNPVERQKMATQVRDQRYGINPVASQQWDYMQSRGVTPSAALPEMYGMDQMRNLLTRTTGTKRSESPYAPAPNANGDQATANSLRLLQAGIITPDQMPRPNASLDTNNAENYMKFSTDKGFYDSQQANQARFNDQAIGAFNNASNYAGGLMRSLFAKKPNQEEDPTGITGPVPAQRTMRSPTMPSAYRRPSQSRPLGY